MGLAEEKKNQKRYFGTSSWLYIRDLFFLLSLFIILLMENKKNQDPLFKEKLILTIEYAVFCVLFLVLGVLILTGILPLKGTFRKVLIYVSLIGGAFICFDLFWTLFSKKRRKRWSLVDKFLAFPAGASVVVIDILTFVWGFEETVKLHETYVGYLFLYLAFVYLFEGIYHYFKPQPLLLEELENEKESLEERKDEKAVDEDTFKKRLEEMENQKKDEK